jgi:hypothetical protein
VFPVGFVPNRENINSYFFRPNQRFELGATLPGETIADANGIGFNA